MDGDGFYEFTDAYREPHSKTSEMEALFKRGQEAARTVYAGERKYQVSLHSHKAVYLSQCRRHIMLKQNSLYASQRIVAKDVVTGKKWHDRSEKGPTICKKHVSHASVVQGSRCCTSSLRTTRQQVWAKLRRRSNPSPPRSPPPTTDMADLTFRKQTFQTCL